MAVRQYIGSRYVPVFAKPIDWTNERTYESLTIVYHQGNSYTSKQAVPLGIDISDETYWALTGNYNAQIEQYRQEVQAFNGRISALEAPNSVTTEKLADSSVTTEKLADNSVTAEKLADDVYSVSDIRKYGAIENSSVDWNSIISQISEKTNTMYIPEGIWNVDTTIIIPNTLAIITGCGVLKATSNIETMVEFSAGESNFKLPSITGITFDANNNAKTCLKRNVDNSFKVSNCNFYNYLECGIDSSSQIGLSVFDCNFSCYTSRSSTSTFGIKTLSDCMISNCKFWYNMTAIECGSGTIQGCYFWCSGLKSMNKRGVAISCEPYFRVEMNIIGCYFDTMPVAFLDVLGNISNCEFAYGNQATPYPDNHTIFLFNSDMYGGGQESRILSFHNNLVRITDEVLDYKVKTILCEGNYKLPPFYSTRDNNLDVKEANMENIYIGFACGSSRTYSNLFYEGVVTFNSNDPSITFVGDSHANDVFQSITMKQQASNLIVRQAIMGSRSDNYPNMVRFAKDSQFRIKLLPSPSPFSFWTCRSGFLEIHPTKTDPETKYPDLSWTDAEKRYMTNS